MERAMPQALPSHEAEPPPGLFETTPRRPTVGDAMRRYWLLILIAIAVFGAMGGYVGHDRKPVYQATASLSVGLLDLTTQSVPGFAVGGEVVAGGFSRAVQTDAIVAPVARELGLSPNEVRGRISSTQVPDSPIFTVSATGASAADAVRLANVVSRSMVTYGRSRSNSASAFARMLRQYRSAVRERDRARSQVAELRSRLTRKPGALGKARADLEAQQLRVDSLGDVYRARATAPGPGAVVQPLVDAQGATSDRGHTTQLYGALGALAGGCVGIALAVLITGARDRRRRRKPS
jgi:hypothetical protein